MMMSRTARMNSPEAPRASSLIKARASPFAPKPLTPKGRARKDPARRGCSSDGRALQSHCRGQGFESPQLHQEVRARARQPPRPSALRARGWGVSPERHHWLSLKAREGKAARPVIGVTVWPGRPRRRKYVAFVGAATTNTRHYWAN